MAVEEFHAERRKGAQSDAEKTRIGMDWPGVFVSCPLCIALREIRMDLAVIVVPSREDETRVERDSGEEGREKPIGRQWVHGGAARSIAAGRSGSVGMGRRAVRSAGAVRPSEKSGPFL